jgi:hypothetical protein
MGWYGLDSFVSEHRPMDGSCENGNKPSVLIKCWKILKQLSDWWLLKKDSAP